MRLLVGVKRTPASTSLALDEKGQVRTEGMPHAINPFDEYALEEALRLKERLPGSTVTVVSLGPPEAEEVLRAALALGADQAALLCDPAFDGVDTLGTSYLLAQAARKALAGQPGVLLFGKQTNDGESGHVTASVAAWLGWPSATSVRKITEASEQSLTVERLMEDGADTLRLRVPAVLGVTKEINEPRLPSLKGKMSAKKAQVPRWGPAELSADAAFLGANAPTRVAVLAPIPARPLGSLISGGSPQEKARNLVAKLKEAKFI